MKLATLSVYFGIQRRGVMVGVPSVYIQCAKMFSESFPVEMNFVEVLNKARTFRVQHAVIQGGDPVQENELPDLIVGLQEEWRDPKDGYNFVRGMHVSVETPAVRFDEAVSIHTDMVTLCPRIHDWNDGVLKEYLRNAMQRPGQFAQLKVLCGSVDDVDTAVFRMYLLYEWLEKYVQAGSSVFFVIEPDVNLGPGAITEVQSGLKKALSEQRAGFKYPVIRMIPSGKEAV